MVRLLIGAHHVEGIDSSQLQRAKQLNARHHPCGIVETAHARGVQHTEKLRNECQLPRSQSFKVGENVGGSGNSLGAEHPLVAIKLQSRVGNPNVLRFTLRRVRP